MGTERFAVRRKPGARALLLTMLAAISTFALTAAPAAAGGSLAQLGPNAQLFGVLASGSIGLAKSSSISFVNQSPLPPEVGGYVVDIGGPTSFLTGDAIASAASGIGIDLANYDTVVGACVTGGASISTGIGNGCGSYDSSGTSTLLTTLSDAQNDVTTYASYLGGLTPTVSLGDIVLKKYQRMTIKLGAGLNVVSIGSITTAGGNTIVLSAPKGAFVVINVGGTISLGAGSQVFTNSSGLNPHDLVWNLEGANPTFGAGVTLRGTLINVVQCDATTVTFAGGSAISGAVLTNGSIDANGPMHLNFWPFTAGAPPV